MQENKERLLWLELTNGDMCLGYITNVTKENFPKIGGEGAVTGVYLDEEETPIRLTSILSIWDDEDDKVLWGFDFAEQSHISLANTVC